MPIPKSDGQAAMYWIVILCAAFVIYTLFRGSFQPILIVGCLIGVAVALTCSFLYKKFVRN